MKMIVVGIAVVVVVVEHYFLMSVIVEPPGPRRVPLARVLCTFCLFLNIFLGKNTSLRIGPFVVVTSFSDSRLRCFIKSEGICYGSVSDMQC